MDTTALSRMAQSLTSENVNVGSAERWLSVVGGGVLTAYGLGRGSLGGLLLAGLGGSLLYRGVTGHCSLYSAMGVDTAERHGSATSVPAGQGVKVDQQVTIARPPEEVYRFVRQVSNMSRFMDNIEAVQDLGDNRSRWTASLPLGATVEWESEITQDRANELIAWRSLPGSTVESAGSIHFQPVSGGQSTNVRLEMKINPIAGKVGLAIAGIMGHSPEQQVHRNMHNLKRLLESSDRPTLATAGRF